MKMMKRFPPISLVDGMFWQSDALKGTELIPLAERLAPALDRYVQKFGRRPAVVSMNPAEFEKEFGQDVSLIRLDDEISVRPGGNVIPNHLNLGKYPPTPTRRDLDRRADLDQEFGRETGGGSNEDPMALTWMAEPAGDLEFVAPAPVADGTQLALF